MSEQDFFVSDEETKQETIDKKEEKKNKQPPKNYLPVKLSSLGKLTAPRKIHVRNYNGADARELALSDEENVLETILDILKGMIWEDVNPEELHEKELEEIMMNIYVNFWSSSLVDYPYPYTEEELQTLPPERRERIKKGEEIPKVVIPHSALDTNIMNEQFKEPITPTVKNEKIASEGKVSFILPRIGHIVKAKQMVEEEYAEEEEKYAKIRHDIEYNQRLEQQNSPAPKREISEDDYDAYYKYLKRRMSYFNLLIQCQMIHSLNGSKLETIEDKMDAYKRTDLIYWSIFNRIIHEYATFGIKEDIEVVSPFTGDNVIRRFQFRLMDFIPTMDTEDISEYDVVFG